MNPNLRAILVTLVVPVFAGACSNKSRCGDDTDCPSIDVPVGKFAAKVHFDPAPDLVLSVDGDTQKQGLTGGGAVFEATDPECTNQCDYSVESLYFELDRVVLSADPNNVVFEDVRIGLADSVTARFDDEYTLPKGTETWGCALVGDEAIATRSELAHDAHLVIDPESSVFSFHGELPFEFHAIPNRECRQFAFVASGFPPAATPWDQRPGCVGANDCPP